MNSSSTQAPCTSKSTSQNSPQDTTVPDAMNSAPSSAGENVSPEIPDFVTQAQRNAEHLASIVDRFDALTLVQNVARENVAPVPTTAEIKLQVAGFKREIEKLKMTLKDASEQKETLREELEQSPKQEQETTERLEALTKKYIMKQAECEEWEARIEALQNRFDEVTRKIEANQVKLEEAYQQNIMLDNEVLQELTRPTPANLMLAHYIKISPEYAGVARMQDLADRILENGEANGDKESMELVAKIMREVQKRMESSGGHLQSASQTVVQDDTLMAAALPKAEGNKRSN